VAGSPANTLAVLIPPLEDLVGIALVLTRHLGNRCTGHKRHFNDPSPLLRRAMNTLRPTASVSSFNHIAHKNIVGLTEPQV
jgi:hypothetical protein